VYNREARGGRTGRSATLTTAPYRGPHNHHLLSPRPPSGNRALSDAAVRSVPGGSHQQVDSCISSLVWICFCRRQKPLGSIHIRKSTKLGYRAKRLTTFASICDDADCKLFTRFTCSSTPAVSAPPPEREHHYTQSLRRRSHNFQLHDRTSALRDKNFITRMLYCDMLFTDNSIF